MDFQQYVDARRVGLVRATVLLGVGQARAPRVVDETLLQQASRIERSPHPDPEVYAALVAVAPEEPASPPDGPGAGAGVRRALAGSDPTVRAIAVLAHFAQLTPHEIGDALGVPPADVPGLEVDAARAIGARDDAMARDLMALAADTVAIGLLTPLDRPRRRVHWPVVAGVAGVLACAVAVTAFVGGNAPTPDGDELADDQVPSLFGYDPASARELLSERGFSVDVRTSPACEPVGLVVGSEPPLGFHVDKGDAVTVLTAAPSGFSCAAVYGERSDAWDFLFFAAGRGPAPAFDDHVEVVVDGQTRLQLTGAQAVDPQSWGDPSALTLLADAISEVYDVPNSPVYRTPSLDVDLEVPPARRCGVPRPRGTAHREALTLTLSIDNVGPYLCPLTLDVYRTPGGAIDVVALYTAQSLT